MNTDAIRLRELFDEAIQLPPVDRPAFLNSRCNGDTAFRLRLEKLIANSEADDSFLSAPTNGDVDWPSPELAGTLTTAQISEFGGTRIGPYKILQQIGEGGFGVVFMAEQERPVVRRVALKIIKLGMDTRQVVARFEAERQALAMMDHPNIARVLDAGATEAGRPYFVMELVRGDPITEYCDTNNLSTRDRLELFAQVCNAVQHAHQKGIIHRDIKPSNVLVTVADGKPIPKVIDFGIAKATAAKLTEKTLFTEHRALIGTPAYMSPEQAEMSGVDIDTRSDIYSLGVLLYELLTGTTPFDPKQLRSAAYGEIQRIIREVEPPTPSTRLSTLKNTAAKLAAHRRTEPAKLSALLRGDLDWIVMKAMEKDRTRRYETANGLAMDVMRYLEGEPVTAAPPSTVYKLRKFVRRNKGAVAAAIAVAAALLLGGIGTTVAMFQALSSNAEARHQAGIAFDNEKKAQDEAARAEREAKAAREARDKAERIAAFMANMFQGVRPSVALGRDTVMLREMLDKAAERIEHDELADAPEAELRLRWTIGSAYVDIAADGALPRAEIILQPTLSLAKKVFGSESEQMATSLAHVADCLESLGRTSEALEKCEEALEIRQRLFQGDHPDVATSLDDAAHCLSSMGRFADALISCKAALEMRQRLHAGDHPDVATTLDFSAYCLNALGRYSEALPQFEAALKMRQRLFQGDHPDIAASLNNLALCLRDMGQPARALPMFEASHQMNQHIFRGDHPEVATTLSAVASCLQSLDRSAEALPKFEAALEMRQRLIHTDHPTVATSLSSVAACLRALGRSAAALPKFEAALEMRQRLFQGDHPDVATSLDETANCLSSSGRAPEALPKFEAALAMRQKLFQGDHPSVAGSLNNMALCLQALGKLDDALPMFEAANEMNKRLFTGDHPEVVASLSNLACCLQSLGRAADALPNFKAALEMNERLFPGGHSGVATDLTNIANCLMMLGRASEALPKHQAALEMRRKLHSGDHPQVAASLNNVANCLKALDRQPEALSKYEAALEMRLRLYAGDHPEVAVSLNNVADCLQSTGRLDEAERKYTEALKMCRRLWGEPHPATAISLHHLADCLLQQGDLERAEPLAREAVQMYRKYFAWQSDEYRHSEQILAQILVARGKPVEMERLRDLVARQREQLPEIDARRATGLATLGSILLKEPTPQSVVEAESLLRECLMIREKVYGPDNVANWVKYETMNLLGAALAAQGKFAQAEPLLLDGYDGMKDDPHVPLPTRTSDRKRDALKRIVWLYETWDAADPGHGHAEKAADWRSQLATPTTPAPEDSPP